MFDNIRDYLLTKMCVRMELIPENNNNFKKAFNKMTKKEQEFCSYKHIKRTLRRLLILSYQDKNDANNNK